MKSSLTLLFSVFFTCLAAAKVQPHTVHVANPLNEPRSREIVEVPGVPEGHWLVHTETGELLPSQRTYDGKLLFPVSLPANGEARYILTPTQMPFSYNTIACGRVYPERVDDVAWENDLVAFRAYGPALQKSGERAFGYDVWCKRATTQPVVEKRYYDELKRGITYHKDHGNGLDCYKVGPTLGAGATGLLQDGHLLYPWAYAACDILDNGPLRFTVRLTYPPRTFNGTQIVERRLISLDAHTPFNRTTVSYEGLGHGFTPVVGIVRHDHGASRCTPNRLAYADPTDPPGKGQGTLFIGALFPTPAAETMYLPLPPQEAKRAGAVDHLIATFPQSANAPLTYYWGAGWSKAAPATFEAWEALQEATLRRLRAPLRVQYLRGK